MKNESVVSERANVSYVKTGSVLLFAATVNEHGGNLGYRLTVEPRLHFKRKGEEDEVYYSIYIDYEGRGEKKEATLRDFTGDRRRAEHFYRSLVKNAVMPEHLQDLFEDVFG